MIENNKSLYMGQGLSLCFLKMYPRKDNFRENKSKTCKYWADTNPGNESRVQTCLRKMFLQNKLIKKQEFYMSTIHLVV